MVNDEPGRLLREQRKAWWTSVLAGQVDQTYPGPRAHITPRFEESTLVISGTVPSEQERQEILADLEQLVGHGITAYQCDLEVVSESDEEPGLLAQTLVGTFDNEDQARFAASVLESRGQIDANVLQILSPGPSGIPDNSVKGLRTLLTEEHLKDIEVALSENHAILVLTVDETQAFQAREILDEETRSLSTVVLPPIPLSVARKALAMLGKATTLPAQKADPETLPEAVTR